MGKREQDEEVNDVEETEVAEEASLDEEAAGEEEVEPEAAEEASLDEEGAREEEVELEAAEEASNDDPLEVANREVEGYKDRWMRLAAEFDNYKKRTSREMQSLIESANEGLIRELLPIIDSVDRALAHGEDHDEAEGAEEGDGFKEGVRMIMNELPKVLANRGLEEIEAEGHPFDPNHHEAMMQIASNDHEAGNVARVVEKGYRMGSRVLRPAKVVVSTGPAEVGPTEGDES